MRSLNLKCIVSGKSIGFIIMVILLLLEFSWLVLGQLPATIDIANDDQDVTLFGADSGDHAGKFSTIAIGDFNDDGIGDILIGAPNGDGPGNGQPESGEAYVVFGKRSFPANVDLANITPPDLVIYGPDRYDYLGTAVAAGDVNGDDIDDIIVGAPGGDGYNNTVGNVGEVHVIFGTPGFSSIVDLNRESADLTILGDQRRSSFGGTLYSNDINGDKLADIIIGAPDASISNRKGAGRVYVIFGSYTLPEVIGLNATNPNILIYGANAEDCLGSALFSSDVSGDNTGDLIIGAPFGDGPSDKKVDAGEAYIIFGKPGLPPIIDLSVASADVTVFGADPSDRLGTSLAGGDLDKDSINDIAIGAPFAAGPGNGRGSAGEVYVIYGNALPPVIDIASGSQGVTVYGSEALDNLGSAIAISDVNNDGTGDLIIGAGGGNGPENGRPGAGEAHLIYGRRSLPSIIDLADQGADAIIYGADALDGLGSSLFCGDVNGDRGNDILVGAVGADGPNQGERPEGGEVYAIFSTSLVPDQPPVANAGPDQKVTVEMPVQLDGSASSDPDSDTLTFNWQFVSMPPESTATLSDPNIVNPTFTSDKLGDYILELTVDDGRGGIDMDQVTITAVSAIMKGDVNFDGQVDLIDAQWVAEYLVGLREFTEEQKYAGDVREPCRPPDTNLDIKDARWIAEFSIGIQTEMFCISNSTSSSVEMRKARAELIEGAIEEVVVAQIAVSSNPVRNANMVAFKVEGRGIESMQVEIFDLAGRQVFASGWVAVGNSFRWNLQSYRGAVVPNGVYLYIVNIRGVDGRFVRSEVRKLAILR